MEPDVTETSTDDSQLPTRAAAPRADGGDWTIGKLIELLDAAIDSAGAQLARSAGLWADSPSPFEGRERPLKRRNLQAEETRTLLEQADVDRGPGPL
ncbi:hypothetical protein JOF29_002783 [Kribbella aluminosa]|uniref:Uncharacterized protein n=1 Tax=Kribbella aluminosa TaxID=416017 RepID=A0ABS4UJA3_9ACTN|nr:hypothetical protein [Kribbella aluminosa]MBP2351700.1 hypothetical protein [Kribbella aluminosa]